MRHGDIAIIGMSCLLPGAPDIDTYWQNIVSKVDAITDPPADTWDANVFYDPNSSENDRVYCKRGGYISPLAFFDPLEHGVMPRTVEGGEPDQWLALQVARAALVDAGYTGEIPERHRTSVILGKGTYLNRGNLSAGQHGQVIDQTLAILKALQPEFSDDDLQSIRRELKRQLPPFNADTAPGLIPNVIAGRIANRLDLMGPSYTVDAACASSLLAVDMAVRDLRMGQCDLALVGGAHVATPVAVLMLFCQLNALARQQQIRPFDKRADGTILGEGIGMVVLKRLEDALRDGQRIYAVIKGVGVSSDGRGMSVMAPRLEGEVLAMRRAYEQAGIAPQTVGLIEAHGTGTLVGDITEVRALAEIFGPRQMALPRVALGSVKSMISHVMPAAGIAGLIKTALALYHKVLPPTLNVDDPIAELQQEQTPFYLNTETRPWIHADGDNPRRAGVNAFGFGGINAHVILEDAPLAENIAYQSRLLRWETEVCVFSAGTRAELVAWMQHIRHWLETAEGSLKDLAYTLNVVHNEGSYRLAIVAQDVEDLRQKLDQSLKRLAESDCRKIKDARGIYFFEPSERLQGQLAFLFPGEGSQYVNMLADLCLHFPQVRACFDQIDQISTHHHKNYVPSDLLFPHPTFSDAERKQAEARLWQMEGAFEAVLIANHALFTLLQSLNIRPDAVVGHSSGEYPALVASGMIELADHERMVQFSLEFHRTHRQADSDKQVAKAALIAVAASADSLQGLINQIDGVFLAMDNCPHQTVIVCGEPVVEQVVEELHKRGLIHEFLPFDRPYHTPLFESYVSQLQPFLERWITALPAIKTYSCTTAAPFLANRQENVQIAYAHWLQPVEFRKTIERMYGDGIRTFVEVGAGGNLTSFVADILRGRPHLTMPANLKSRSGITQLNHLAGILVAHGVPIQLEYLYGYRAPQKLDLDGADASAQRAHRLKSRMRLATGWPPMTLSREFAAGLRAGRDQANPAPPLPIVQPLQPSERNDNRENGAQIDGKPVSTNQPTSPGASTDSRQYPLAGNELADSHPPLHPSPAPTPSANRVMGAHFETMNQFLAAQEEVMQAYLAHRPAALPSDRATGATIQNPPPLQNQIATPGGTSPINPAGISASHRAMPLIDRVVSLIPGERLVAHTEINLEEHLFLHDHTLGRQLSVSDPALVGLPIMPLTFSMEMLAEAAALLAPGKRLIEMRNIRAHRWLALDDDSQRVELAARRDPSIEGDAIEVALREIDANGKVRAPAMPPIIEGTIIFGDTLPEPPEIGRWALRGERPSQWLPAQLYRDVMFHGPAFRNVLSVDQIGEDGAVATLQRTQERNLLRSYPNQTLLTDPVLLDQPGQVVGMWTAETLARGYVIFPFQLEKLSLYDVHPSKEEDKIQCLARIHLVGEHQVRSDLDLVESDGRVRTRFVGWEDRRFNLPDHFVRSLLSMKEIVWSEPWLAPLASLPEFGDFQLYRLNLDAFPPNFFTAHDSIWLRVLAHLVLSRRERALWRNLNAVESRRLEWLIGRVVAKDAVRQYLGQQSNLLLYPADIEILPDEHRRPVVHGDWLRMTPGVPLLSISHANKIAVAMTGYRHGVAGLGLDIEPVGQMDPAARKLAFAPSEQALLSSLSNSDSDYWPLRLWCAKEAIAKALGRGMIGGPQAIVVQALDPESGTVQMRFNDALAQQFPTFGAKAMTAYTMRDHDLIIATAFHKPELDNET
jgi:acyl transferase domain-containing protein/phosphopantetheinyl transferase